ncbi:choice-of-anchor F family protein [Marinobacter sp.]|uniref:choice-of-anchor F family protein n=1 Tax=Marinobacter sp. TaxID=50741 RepID=UPI003564544D
MPQLTGWNEVNRLTVQPGIDGYTGASARTQIYTSETAKQAAADALAADPDGSESNIEDLLWTDSPAAVYWELDDGSGRPPGIQVVTDDFDFPTNNCIMASGERESTEFPGTVVPKLCSDPPSSSKRYFLEIREADVPVDLVFDFGVKDIRYGGVKDPEDDGGEALEAFRQEYGIGRIYRAIQKVINNSDERWAAINVEIGRGVGDGFQRFNFADDGVAFELRNFVPREFFEGETGAPDIEVWNPDRYATFSPKLYDDGSRERFDPGFFDAQAGGMFPPQQASGSDDKSPFIFSGTATNPDTGATGAITGNHFSMLDNQAAGSSLNQFVFGYMLSDSLAPSVVAIYEDGNPEGESDAIEAWWDGQNWRYGQAGDESGLNPFGAVPLDQLEQWAAKPLGLDIDGATPERYQVDLSDDLATQNMDVFIYIGEEILDETGAPRYDTLTLRVEAVSVAEAGLTGADGATDPLWTQAGNEAPLLASYLPESTTPVALNDLATTIGTNPVEINLLENDILNQALLSTRISDGAVTATVVETQPANGTVTVDASGIATYTADADFAGADTFTYVVRTTDDDGTDGFDYGTDTESNTATVTVRVDTPPDPDAPVAANDSAVTFFDTPVTIDVLANDTLPTGTPTVEILDDPSSSQGTAVVEDNKIVFTPNEAYTAFDVPARFTYRVTVNGKESNAALVTVRIDDTPEIYVPPAEPSSGSGGCSYKPGAPFDPTLLLLALAAIGGVAYRNRRREQQQ